MQRFPLHFAAGYKMSWTRWNSDLKHLEKQRRRWRAAGCPMLPGSDGEIWEEPVSLSNAGCCLIPQGIDFSKGCKRPALPQQSLCVLGDHPSFPAQVLPKPGVRGKPVP